MYSGAHTNCGIVVEIGTYPAAVQEVHVYHMIKSNSTQDVGSAKLEILWTPRFKVTLHGSLSIVGHCMLS